MASDDKLWLLTWGILGTTLITIVFSFSLYYSDKNTKIVSLIDRGYSPLVARCALEDNYGRNPTCIIIATKSEKILKK